MKSPRFLLFAAVVAAIFSLGLSPVPARADDAPDAKRLVAAEEFLKARKMDDLVNTTASQMADGIDRISDGIARQASASVNQGELLLKMRAEARAMMSREVNWETVRPAFIDAYAKAFTEAELHELTAFYKSPTGQKLVAVDPQALGQLEKTSRDRAMAALPKIVQRLREMVAAANPPGSSPPLVAPPMPPGLTVPPPPPPSGMIPPSAPPAMNPPAATPPAVPPPAPNGTPAVHPPGKSEPGNQ